MRIDWAKLEEHSTERLMTLEEHADNSVRREMEQKRREIEEAERKKRKKRKRKRAKRG